MVDMVMVNRPTNVFLGGWGVSALNKKQQLSVYRGH